MGNLQEVLRSVYWMKRGMRDWSAETMGHRCVSPGGRTLFRELLEETEGGKDMSAGDAYQVMRRDLHLMGPVSISCDEDFLFHI